MCSLNIFVCEFSTCQSSLQCFSRKTSWFHACYFQTKKVSFLRRDGSTSYHWPLYIIAQILLTQWWLREKAKIRQQHNITGTKKFSPKTKLAQNLFNSPHCEVIIGRNPIEANTNTDAIQQLGNPVAYIRNCFTLH